MVAVKQAYNLILLGKPLAVTTAFDSNAALISHGFARTLFIALINGGIA